MSIRIGVIGTADIAKRRMIPAIMKSPNFEYIGVAIASSSEWEEPHSEEEYKSLLVNKKLKADEFVSLFGGVIYQGYESLLSDSSIDAVYIPLPPALHHKWAMKALEYGKHVLIEKPVTVSIEETKELIEYARKKKLAVSENYGFVYHKQFKKLTEILQSGVIGELRLIRGTFGFPHRDMKDFRYSKKYGGGALLDCGGYTIKAAACFMNNPKIVSSSLTKTDGHEVDVFGSVTLRDINDIEAQLAFGMDNSYKCDFELWGSKGAIISNRAYTAPDTFDVVLKLSTKDGIEEICCGDDDQFLLELEHFGQVIRNEINPLKEHSSMLQLGDFITEILRG